MRRNALIVVLLVIGLGLFVAQFYFDALTGQSMSDPPPPSSGGSPKGYCCPIPVSTQMSGSQTDVDTKGKTCIAGDVAEFEKCTLPADKGGKAYKAWAPTELQCNRVCAGCEVCEAIENGDVEKLPPGFKETYQAAMQGSQGISDENKKKFCEQFGAQCKVVTVKLGSTQSIRCEPNPSAGCPVYYCDRAEARKNMSTGSTGGSAQGEEYCKSKTTNPSGEMAKEFGYLDKGKCGERCNGLPPAQTVVPPPSGGTPPSSGGTGPGPGSSASTSSAPRQLYCCGRQGSGPPICIPKTQENIDNYGCDATHEFTDSTCDGRCNPPVGTLPPAPPSQQNTYCCYHSNNTPVGCMLRWAADAQGKGSECLGSYTGANSCQAICPPPDSSASSTSYSSSSTSTAPKYCCYRQSGKPVSCLLRPVHEGAECTGDYTDPLVCAATERCPVLPSSSYSSSSRSSTSSSSSSSSTSEMQVACCDTQGSTRQCSMKALSQCPLAFSPAYSSPIDTCNQVCKAAETSEIKYTCGELRDACQTQCPVISIFGFTLFSGCMGDGGGNDQRCPDELCAIDQYQGVSAYTCDVKPDVCQEEAENYCFVNGQCVPAREGVQCSVVFSTPDCM